MSRESDKRERARRNERIANLQWLMGDKRGRAFVWSQIEDSYLFSGLMTNNSGQTSWLIGKRDLGKALYDEVRTHCWDEYWLMENEARERDQIAAAEPKSDPDPYPEPDSE